MRLVDYNNFLIKESKEDDNFINDLIHMPIDSILATKNFIKKINEDEELNEELSYISDKYKQFKRWLNEKLMLYLINQSVERRQKILEKLDMFDPTNLDNIESCDTIYLGGGIDKTPDEYIIRIPQGDSFQVDLLSRKSVFDNILEKITKNIPGLLVFADNDKYKISLRRGTDLTDAKLTINEINCMDEIESGGSEWRSEVEIMFEPDIEEKDAMREMGDNVKYDHIPSPEDMARLSYKGLIDKSKYKKPIIMNPLRNEVIRLDDKYRYLYDKWKKGKLTDKEEYKYMAKMINKNIKGPDLRVLNVCDANLVKYDESAGAGTYGELTFDFFKRPMAHFVWVEPPFDITVWNIPDADKIVRNRKELEMLVQTIKDFNKRKI
jgi:hypothetical protein